MFYFAYWSNIIDIGATWELFQRRMGALGSWNRTVCFLSCVNAGQKMRFSLSSGTREESIVPFASKILVVYAFLRVTVFPCLATDVFRIDWWFDNIGNCNNCMLNFLEKIGIRNCSAAWRMPRTVTFRCWTRSMNSAFVKLIKSLKHSPSILSFTSICSSAVAYGILIVHWLKLYGCLEVVHRLESLEVLSTVLYGCQLLEWYLFELFKYCSLNIKI